MILLEYWAVTFCNGSKYAYLLERKDQSIAFLTTHIIYLSPALYTPDLVNKDA